MIKNLPLVLSITYAIAGGTNLASETGSSDRIEKAERPNIVLILCDDLGYADVGFNGSTDIRTPELDRLARGGMIMSAGYVAHPFCGPSRMALMSGRYPHTFGAPFNLPNSGLGIEQYNRDGIPIDQALISTVLQDAGYYTGAVGKWHMGMERPFHPNQRGFDDFFGFLGGGHMYFPEKYGPIYERQKRAGKPHINEYVIPLEHNGDQVSEREYMTDALSREAARFVTEASARNQPFFLYLAYNAPHTPLEARKADLALYAGIKDKKRRTYAAMVHAVDRGVGRLREALQQTDELDNTLIVFLSDNGGKTSSGAVNRPLNNGKGSVMEGGFRVPMFFHYPGKLEPGSRFDHTVTAIDFYPTFAALAKAEVPDHQLLDGQNIWPSLVSGTDPRDGEMIFALRHRSGFSDVGARRNEWKVSRVGNGPWKLFNLAEDISETRDLRSQHPQLAEEMVKEVERWSSTHTPPRWFHELDARDNWIETEMPNYNQTFSMDPTFMGPDAAAGR